jgi:type II secretory pathway component PulC
MLILGACIDANAVPEVDVEQAEVVARRTGEQVVAGLDTARDKVVAVGGDLRTAAGQAAARTVDPRSVEPAAADALARDATTAVACPEPERCTIAAAYADRLRANPGFLATQARVVPHRSDGRADGLEISELEALPRALGFQARDVVHSINGLRVQSLQSAPQLYLQLRSARRFTVVFTRGSEQRTRVIEIG